MTAHLEPPADSRVVALNNLRPELHRYCARLMASVIDGEDVVQDTYLRALAALTHLRPEVPLRPWLFRIAHNRALDLLRGEARRRSEPVEDDLIDDRNIDALDSLMRRDAITLAITQFSALPATQRSVVILKDVLDDSLAFIANLLDLSIDAVKAHLARGRARLRGLSAPEDDARRPSSPEVLRFITLFNARDWEALRAQLADDARLQQSTYPLRSGPSVRDFFGIYATYGDVRLAPAWLEGREVITVFEGGAAMASHMMWLEWRDGLITFIRDYRYVAYVLAETPV